MNQNRRKRIKDAIKKIEYFVQDILDDEQEAYDNLPEGLKMSANGVTSEEAQENLEAAIEALEEAIMCLEAID